VTKLADEEVCMKISQLVRPQEHLTTATTMYREMGMTYWLEKAEVELGVE
jgi:hypothetical protein